MGIRPDRNIIFQWLTVFTALILMVFANGCSSSSSSSSGGGGGGGGSDADLEEYVMPSEISAVPTAENVTIDYSQKTLRSYLQALISAYYDEDTDYSKAGTSKYVEENALKQFAMLETVLDAFSQTNYIEEIDGGAYTAMVAFEEEEEGQTQKSLEKWVVQANGITESGASVLRVRAWVEEGPGRLVKAELKIYTPPTQNEDGSYEDYGEWTLNVSFDDENSQFFVASCEAGDNGMSIVKLHEKFEEEFGGPPGGEEEGEEEVAGPVGAEGDGLEMVSKGIMYRSATEGYGKVYYPDFDAFFCPDCEQGDTMPHATAAYAYNEEYLAVGQDSDEDGEIGEGERVYKDRDLVVEMTHRYGVFDADTGADIMKSKSFGFPIRYEDAESGFMGHAYYGSWQGRHEIWSNNESGLPEGTEVVTETHSPDEEAVAYTVGPTFNGVLVKRTMIEASVEDIKNIPVEIWINNDYSLVYSDSVWNYCTQMNWGEIEGENPVHVGTVDLSSGVDWSIENQSFSIAVNGGAPVEITLAHNYAHDGDIAGALMGEFSDAGINVEGGGPFVEAYSDDSGHVGIRMWEQSSRVGFQLIAGSPNDALAEIGWTAGTYQGVDMPPCMTDLINFEDEVGLASLTVAEDDHRKHVNISGWDMEAQMPMEYVYRLEFTVGETTYPADFYEAEFGEGEHGPMIVLAEPITAIDTDSMNQLWANLGGSIYVEYTGDTTEGKTGWVEKELVNFDERTWSPEFNEEGDKDYILPSGKELYINMQGANYIAQKDPDSGELDVYYELQTACTPENAATIVPDGTAFKDQWCPEFSSTYEFITDPAEDNYLMLVYLTIGDNDKDQDGEPKDGAEVGAIAGNLWGLVAVIDEVDVQFNWEYNESGGFGSVTYLLDEDGEYKLLDDPLRFDSITATNNGGEEKTLVMQYDGWMMGLPDLYRDLEKNGWIMNEDLSNKIINLPAGTQVTEAQTGDDYVLKPLDISQFLSVIADTTGLDLPDIASGSSVDLTDVPDFVDHGMGDMPTGTTVKYSEGVAVE